MDINEYQARAADTIQFDSNSSDAVVISLLGISGEVGELLTEYKKRIRDGESYKLFKQKVVEELGDILWYLSTVATLEDVELQEVLDSSLIKIGNRWDDLQHSGQMSLEEELLDDGYNEFEQFPREFVAEFRDLIDGDGNSYATISVNGKPFGDELRDNAYDDDYYRFHDVFHLSYVVVLGWSPIARRFLDRKRRSDSGVDEVEDGGRASVIDEAISALVFEYARTHNFFEGTGGVDYELLRTIKMLTKHLEVAICSERDWEKAILLGFDMWRMLKKSKNGRIVCKMHEKTMIFEDLESVGV